MLSINTNLSSLIAQSSMKTSTDKLNQAVERMTTGYKINHSKDNAANYSIATNMTTKINSYMIAEDNCAMGLDMLATANGSLDQISDKLTRLRDLATQAGNGTYGTSSLQAINKEANAIVDEINRLYSTAEYNGMKLFGGETTPVASIATFAMTRSATTENYFISDPITYTDAEVEAMTTMTEAVANSSLVSGGTYSISTVDELVALADYVNSGNSTTGMTFVLGADIDLSSISNWTPIGDYSTDTNYQFKGIFDGNGQVIKNLTIDNETKDYQGLFGYVISGEIKNVGLEDVNIKGQGYVGGLTGGGRASISNCYVTGNVTGTGKYLGGLVGCGYSNSSISNSYATCTVSGDYGVGGLVGSSFSIISNCYATGDVTGTDNCVGGLAGYAGSDAVISNSYAIGTVTGNTLAGGLVGRNYSTISNSYATGAVTGDGYVGGLVGWNHSTISNSYATGTVTGNSDIGGLAGCNGSTINNSYATGAVTGNYHVGGLLGYAVLDSTISNSYATGTASGTSKVGGLVSYYPSSYSVSNCASVQTDSDAIQMTEEEIEAMYTPEYMGFTDANGWTIVDNTPILTWQTTSYAGNSGSIFGTDDSGDTDSSSGTSTGPTYAPDTVILQIGTGSDWTSQIGVDIKFTLDDIDELRMIGLDTTTDFITQLDEILVIVNAKQTEYGAAQNRLESALDEISILYENLVSSRSTLRDADIAEVSSEYIRQQILQQASSTLLATANQSPAIALQLI